MFKPILAGDNIPLGYELIDQNNICFFGTQRCDSQVLNSLYPEIHFLSLKQVHGEAIIQAERSKTSAEADAHWTNEKNLGLFVFTADCIPLLISHPERVSAIHAGWRGVRKNIAASAIANFKMDGCNLSLAHAFIGPCIARQSFEVDTTLAQNFTDYLISIGCPVEKCVFASPYQKDKAYIDLIEILKFQLISAGIKSQNIMVYVADTKTDSRFASYRRDNKTSLRNISFVSRL